jgi:hypothetical protein
MSNVTQWITAYLEAEADRVLVDDRLHEVQHGIQRVTLVTNHRDVRPRVLSVVVASVAAVAMIAIGVATLSHGTAPASNGVYAGSPNTIPVAPTDPIPPTTTPIAIESSTSISSVTELPEGGLTLGGQVPQCQKISADQYDCTLSEPWPGDVPNYDDTGYVEFYRHFGSERGVGFVRMPVRG